jgi:hypothetical protein
MNLPSGGWQLSYCRVSVPPVPHREPERSTEIRRVRRYLPPDLRDDPTFDVESNQWNTWCKTEEEGVLPRRL